MALRTRLPSEGAHHPAHGKEVVAPRQGSAWGSTILLVLPVRELAESLIELLERLHGLTPQKIAESAMFCAARLIWSSLYTCRGDHVIYSPTNLNASARRASLMRK